jgi:hypothetical protein
MPSARPIAHLILIDSEELTCSPSSGSFRVVPMEALLGWSFRDPARASKRHSETKKEKRLSRTLGY